VQTCNIRAGLHNLKTNHLDAHTQNSAIPKMETAFSAEMTLSPHDIKRRKNIEENYLITLTV
jgi:hypothetical protein